MTRTCPKIAEPQVHPNSLFFLILYIRTMVIYTSFSNSVSTKAKGVDLVPVQKY
jgi:hypothetical protein